jgi:hypothetical protein
MDDLKFSCPACGQHISCGKAYGGHVIHCPNCCAELRVPFSDSHHELSEVKADLVTTGSGPHAAPETGAGKTVAVPDGKELHCRCPVCQSHLRIPAAAAAQPDDVFPSAELVLQPGETAREAPKPAAEAAAPAPPLSEREQHIAAERAARPLSLYPQMKPRLDLLLGGKSKNEPEVGGLEDAA